jgi:uncharacterized protein (TIGR03083 family)
MEIISQLGGIQPILCAATIREVDRHLIDLLSSLTLVEWDTPTVAPRWCVRDVAAHLLDTALRKLSGGRDRHRAEKVELRTPQDLIDLVNRLNREGVTVYRRLSPRVLIELMRLACEQTADLYESLDPFAMAMVGVSWAGEDRSLVWFDTARELTERWHHQQQIRLATGRPGIMTRQLYYPVLDTFLRGLPHTFRSVPASIGASLLIEVTGDCGGQWCLVRAIDGWSFGRPSVSSVSATISIPQSIAWRLFTKGIDRDSAVSEITITGDFEIAEPALTLTAIVA